MLKAVLVALGSHGDVHPFLAIGRALRSRGMRAIVAVPPHFRDDVAAAGLEFASLGEGFDTEALLRHPDLMHPRRGGRVVLDRIFDATPERVRALEALCERERPDAIVTHHVAFGARWVAARRGIPCAVACLAPLMWFSPSDPAPSIQRRAGRWRAAVARMQMKALRPLVPCYGDRLVNRVREKAGFARERGVFLADWNGGDANLGLWSRHYRGPTPDDPAAGRITGFPYYDGPAALDPRLEAFLGAGDPPVVFSLGTAAVHTPRGFYEIAAETCRRLSMRGVLLVGRGGAVPAALPPDVAAFESAPFSLLFPRAAASVHHGGIGSVAQSLRSGRPFVAVPHAHDQFNNSLRAVNLGVAAALDRRRLTPEKLARALRQVLGDEAVARRAEKIAAAIRAEDGALAAAREIERLARRS